MQPHDVGGRGAEVTVAASASPPSTGNEANASSRKPKKRKSDYRTVFISDAHLGSRACEADALAQFLKNIRCDRLYLVGDIVDMWRLKQRWYWPGAHNNVIRRILNHTKHATDVILIPGNHDEAARQFYNLDFGGIRVLPFAVHVTADGSRLLVTHGDQFDLVVRHSRLASMLGSKAYDSLVIANRWYNKWRQRFGRPYVSMSKAIKGKVKSACMFISRFEETLMTEAKRRGMDGVVCGHIHQPEIREDSPIRYYNCGDWVENCTALVEHYDGRLEIIHASDLARDADAPPSGTDEEPVALAELIRWNPEAMSRHDSSTLTFGEEPLSPTPTIPKADRLTPLKHM